MDKKYIGDTAMVIHNSKVLLFIAEEPFHLIVIENKKVAETYKKQFELLWKIAK